MEEVKGREYEREEMLAHLVHTLLQVLLVVCRSSGEMGLAQEEMLSKCTK